MAKGAGSGKQKKTAVSTDERFSAIHNDPRFRLPKRDDIKVELDDRFKKSDLEAIKRKAKIDKYGRKIKSKDTNEPFSKYYKTKEDNEKKKSKKEESEDSEESDESKNSDDEEEKSEDDSEENEVGSPENDSENEELEAATAGVDLARGEGLPSDYESSSDESSSDEESSEEEEEDDDEDEEGKPEEGDPSRRFAVVNLDWDNVKSVDLMATFQSFVPSSGHIEDVSIYPSEFGKERMQKEDIEGPPKELFKSTKKNSKESKDSDDDDSDSELEAKDLYEEDDGKIDYDHKSLRRYQLQRLRYYYAVVTCDSIATAQNIYNNCDGTEFESTANLFDLRYIPDEMDFDDEARDSCNKIPTNYKPQTFVTDALQHSKVKLTWDETPAERVRMSSKAFSQRELDDMDFKAYLASDNSDDEGSEDEDLKNKYKNLVGLSSKIGNKNIFEQKDDDEDDVDMEITFTPGLDEKSGGGDSGAPEEGEEESTLDKLKRKAKERRKSRKDKIKELKKEAEEQKKADKPAKNKKGKKPQENEDADKKAELELLMLDEDNKKHQEHFNLKELMRSEKEKAKKSKHRNKDKIIEDDFKPDLNDPRFKEIFTNHEFAIDPSQPQFKKTATMSKILEERNKRRDEGEHNGDKPSKKVSKAHQHQNSKKRKNPSSESDDVNSLVERIKRKSKH